MALTTPRGFAGGPMADIDYGLGAGSSAWFESTAAMAVSQPNAGTRSLSIAAGQASAYGIRVSNDAALTQGLGAPSSGGAWYLLVLRFDWSVKTVSVQVLAGPTTGSTSTPSGPPNTTPSGLNTTPGSKFDLPLAWVFTSSATTALPLFDMRILRTGALGLAASTLWALGFLNLIAGFLQPGAVVSVLGYTAPSGAVHTTSLWVQRGVDGRFLPSGKVTGAETAGQTLLRDHVVGAVGLYSASLALQVNESEVFDTQAQIVYRFRSGGIWSPWSSPWLAYTPTLAGLTLGTGGQISGRYRWENGRIKVQIWGLHGSSSSFSGGVTATVPEPVSMAANSPAGFSLLGDFFVLTSGSTTPYTGRVRGSADGVAKVDLMVDQVNATFNFLTTYAANQPVAAAQSTQFWAEFAYESSNYLI